MAESKSKWFALFINARSEKSREFDLNPFKSLADISECRMHVARSDDDALPSEGRGHKFEILSGAPADQWLSGTGR